MSLNQQTKENIFSAHCIRGIPQSEIMIPYPNIRSLLESQVLRYSNKTFIVFYSKQGSRIKLSYKQFLRKINQGANFLESHGLGYSDRIMIRARNDLDTLFRYFAVWMIGSTPLPVSNKIISRIKSGKQTGSKDPIYLFMQQSNVDSTLLDAESSFGKAVFDQKNEFKIGKKSKLSDDALIVFANNGNGKKRGIILTHYNMLVDASAIIDRHGLTDESTILCCVPLCHVTGIMGCFLASLYAGCSFVLFDAGEENHFPDRVIKEKIEYIFINSPQLSHFENGLNRFIQNRKTSIRHFICSHQNLTVQKIAEILDRYGIRIIPGFELPEATCFSSFFPVSHSHQEYLKWISSHEGLPVGTALHPAEMNIIDSEGNEQKEGTIGQIVIRGHHVMKGYLNDEQATAGVFKYGWLNSGEEGFYRLGADGNKYFTVTGKRLA